MKTKTKGIIGFWSVLAVWHVFATGIFLNRGMWGTALLTIFTLAFILILIRMEVQMDKMRKERKHLDI